MKSRLPSLEQLIRKKIERRIITAMTVLVLATIIFTILEGALSYAKLEVDLENRSLSLQDSVISEVLVNNRAAIWHIIDEANQSYPNERVTWIPLNDSETKLVQTGLAWHLPCNWTFTRRLDKLGQNFGLFIFEGSFLTSGNLIVTLGRRVAFALVLSLVMGNLLFPIAKRTPRDLILEPIQDLVKLLNTDPSVITAVSHARYQEMKSIEEDVKHVIIERMVLDRERLEAEQMKAMTKTAQLLAHDIKRPFAVITSIIDSLPAAQTMEEVHELLNETVPGVKRAFTCLDIALTRLQGIENPNAQDEQTLDVSSIVSNGVENALCHNRSLMERVHISIPALLQVRGDSFQLQRVITNLVSNAFQAMKEQDQVWITAERIKDSVRIVVKNSGSFIPENERKKVFECFYTKGDHKGSGIGLAICKQIIKEHNGTIEVSSLENPNGKSTSFLITLPLCNDEFSSPATIRA